MNRTRFGLILWMAGMLGVWGQAGSSKVESEGKRTLLIVGDSLAAGYGVEETQGFVGLLERKVAEAKLGYAVVNAGVSGDTTAGGRRRLGWLLRRPVDVMLIELGGNDGLRGLPPEATRSNLVSMVDEVRRKNPQVRIVLAGMRMPPNLGEDYGRRFADVYPSVAKEKGLVLIPHLLEGVGGRPEMNLPDMIHPTPEGHAVVASNVWLVLKPVLEMR